MPELELLKQIVMDVGVPITICIVFVAIVIDAYRFNKQDVRTTMKEQTDSLEKVVHCSTETVEVLKKLNDKLDRNAERQLKFNAEIKFNCPALKDLSEGETDERLTAP